MPATVKELRVGALKIGIILYADGRYGFDWSTEANERKQVRKRSIEAAEQKARELLGSSKAGKVDLLRIDPDEYMEFLQWRAERKVEVPVPDVVKAFLKAKSGKGRSSKHMAGLKHSLESFAQAFKCPIGKLKRAAVEQWLDDRKVGPRRWNNLRADLVTLIRFARQEELISKEVSPVERIEKKAATVTVTTYTPDELERMLRAAWKEWLPSLVLGAYAGLRPEEIYPDATHGKRGLQWEHILWDKGVIDVPADVSKTRRRRLPPLNDAAKAWLTRWRDAKGPVAHEKRFWSYIPTLEKSAKVEWRPDALRHSFASYTLAITENVHALSLAMGNSPSMLFKHYLNLQHKDEAQKWFAIRP